MNIFVYGTGCGAGELIDSALPAERVTAFVDSRPSSDSFLGRPVILPEELAKRDYDLVIVTSRSAEAIADRCTELGIDPDRLLFLKNNAVLTDRNRSYEAARSVLGADYVETLRHSHHLVRAPVFRAERRLPEEELENDYIRLKALETLCAELRDVPGETAELGVYRGAFARCLNMLLPERKLYLFDTFEGFAEPESAGYGEGFVRSHKNTSAGLVLSALPFPEQAVLCAGLFPGSAESLEEPEALRFALVSLDVDLEESTYQGLCWFMPRMSPGGYLLLHDYNNPKLSGVRAAVEHFEREHGRLCRVPLCDVNGTLVICG